MTDQARDDLQRNALDLSADPPRMLLRRMRPVSQADNTAAPITGDPPVHGLPGHSEAFGDLGYRDAIPYLQHGLVSLLDHVHLPKHERECHASSEATVSHIKRSLTLHNLDQRCLTGLLQTEDYARAIITAGRPDLSAD
jgi:hypothetical protein